MDYTITSENVTKVNNLPISRSVRFWDTPKHKLINTLSVYDVRDGDKILMHGNFDSKKLEVMLSQSSKLAFCWNDDTRKKKTSNGDLLIVSCDSAFGAILLQDGTFYLGNPYTIYDGSKTDTIEFYGKGVWHQTEGKRKLYKFKVTEFGKYSTDKSIVK